MDVSAAIESRRAYRSLKRTDITEDLIRTLAQSASLSASCYNHRFERKTKKR